MKKKYKHSLIVARFQPFHNGHKTIIDQMIKDSKNITIVLGSAQESRTNKNPLNVAERKSLIENIYGKKQNIKILALNDIHDDDKWFDYLMTFVRKKTKKFGEIDAYYCGSKQDSLFYINKWFDVNIIDREKQTEYKKISATEIRNMIYNCNKSWKKYIPQENKKLIEKYFNIKNIEKNAIINGTLEKLDSKKLIKNPNGLSNNSWNDFKIYEKLEKKRKKKIRKEKYIKNRKNRRKKN